MPRLTNHCSLLESEVGGILDLSSHATRRASALMLLLALHPPDLRASIEAVHVSGAQGGLTLRRNLASVDFLTKSEKSQAILKHQRQSVISLLEARDDIMILAIVLPWMVFLSCAVCIRVIL